MVDETIPPVVQRRGDLWQLAERPADEGRRPVTVHFDIGDLFALNAINLLLTVITIGIYRFWAKTRMRRYLWHHVAFDGERLEYTGRAVELLIGFLIVAVFILLPLIASDIYINNVLIFQNQDLASILSGVTLIFVLFMVQVALYRARRYRLTRTHWRGVRGGQSGTGWAYALRVFAYWALAGLSLGLTIPWGRTRLMAYKLGHTWFGDHAVGFRAPAGGLYRTFIRIWFCAGGGFAVLAFVMFLISTGTTLHTDLVELDPATMKQLEQTAAVVTVAYVFLVIIYGIVLLSLWAWYRSRELAHFTAHTRFMDLRFAFRPKMTDLFRLWVGNWFIAVFSLGFGAPWIYRRNGRFVATRLHATGDLDLDALMQSQQDRPGRGEGLADAFDVDGFG